MDAVWWVWSALLLVAAVALTVAEIFIPSGGILGFLSICAVIGSVVVAFMQGPVEGACLLATAVFALPAAIVLALKWWPRTPVGRKVLLDVPGSDDVLPDDDRRRYRSLIGRTGKAKSDMLPGGVIVIDGRSMDALSDGVPIEAGQPVRVVDVHATTLIVRPLENEPDEEKSPQDPLAQPIDSVVPDPFEEPGA